MRRLRAVAWAAVLVVSGCGAAYVPTSVTGEPEDGVLVLDMTPATISTANAQPFTPRRLPAAFSRTASGAGATPRPATQLPEPVFAAQDREATPELRLPPAVDPGPYLLGVGDVLAISTITETPVVEDVPGILGQENVRQTYTVQDDGAITIAAIGRVQVAGQTLEDAEDAIFQRFIDARVDPSIGLEIDQFNSQRVSVGGLVGRPSVVPVDLTPLTLDEALARSGGLRPRDPAVTVIRIYRDGILYQIPLDAFRADPSLRNTRLLGGDSVFVDTSFQLDLASSFLSEQITRANFSRAERAARLSELSAEITRRRAALAEARQVFVARSEFGAEDRDFAYVMGEVGIQRRFPLPYETEAVLADALFDSGGINVITGDPAQIYVLRAADAASAPPGAAVLAYRLNAQNAAAMVLATQFELRPNDVLFIAEQPITRWNRLLAQVFPVLQARTELLE